MSGRSEEEALKPNLPLFRREAIIQHFEQQFRKHLWRAFFFFFSFLSFFLFIPFHPSKLETSLAVMLLTY